jgi:hypothetical protein
MPRNNPLEEWCPHIHFSRCLNKPRRKFANIKKSILEFGKENGKKKKQKQELELCSTKIYLRIIVQRVVLFDSAPE